MCELQTLSESINRCQEIILSQRNLDFPNEIKHFFYGTTPYLRIKAMYISKVSSGIPAGFVVKSNDRFLVWLSVEGRDETGGTALCMLLSKFR